MNKIPICEYCGLPITNEKLTRNKRHHSACAYRKKLVRSKETYLEMKSLQTELKRNDSILSALYLQFGSDSYIPLSLLLNAKFNFGLKLYDHEENGLKGIGFGQFGFYFFKNDTFKIFKNSNNEPAIIA